MQENANVKSNVLKIISYLLDANETKKQKDEVHYSNGKMIHNRMAGWMTPLDYCYMGCGASGGGHEEFKDVVDLLKPF